MVLIETIGAHISGGVLLSHWPGIIPRIGVGTIRGVSCFSARITWGLIRLKTTPERYARQKLSGSMVIHRCWRYWRFSSSSSSCHAPKFGSLRWEQKIFFHFKSRLLQRPLARPLFNTMDKPKEWRMFHNVRKVDCTSMKIMPEWNLCLWRGCRGHIELLGRTGITPPFLSCGTIPETLRLSIIVITALADDWDV